MKKFLLLILTLFTLKAIGQDTITTEKPVDPLLSKITTFHDKISNLNLDISTLKLNDINWEKLNNEFCWNGRKWNFENYRTYYG